MDLLLDAVWTRLSDGARAHARTLTVLRVPAPWQVIEDLGTAVTTTELTRAGMLTRFREQALGDGKLKWLDRWGMHSLVGGFAGQHVEEKARLEAHRAAGIAYAAWVEQRGARWSEQVEGSHTCTQRAKRSCLAHGSAICSVASRQSTVPRSAAMA